MGTSSADSCTMYDGDCGSTNCIAGSGQTCHDCQDSDVCCVEPASTNNCNWGNGCGSGNCVASAGQTCNDCSNKRMCAICSDSVTPIEAQNFLNNKSGFVGTDFSKPSAVSTVV